MKVFDQRIRRAMALWLVCCSLLLLTMPRFALPAYGASNLFTWETSAASPIARMEAQGALLGGKLYVFGGFYDTALNATTRSDAYTVQSNSWARIADMPEALTHAAQAVDGATIFLLGGYLGKDPGPSTRHVWKYNTLTNSWSAGPDLPAARGAGAAAVVGRELHYFAGALRTMGSSTDNDTGEHWVLDLDAPTGWRSEPALPLPRNHSGAVALGGKIYVVGGQLGRAEATTSQVRVDVYNPASNSWARAADLPAGRSHIASSILAVDGRIIILGGSVNGGSSGLSSSDVLSYDPASNLWLRMKALPAGRKSPVAGYSAGQIVVATGNSGSPSATTWRASLPNSWEQAGAMPIALGEVAGGIIGSRLYLVGEGSSATLSYNLSNASWTSSGLASRPHAGNHHAAEVVGGKLYLFGGLGSGAGKVQIYNPATNAWSLGRDMPFAAGSSSSALINGKVYVAGGIVGSSTTAQVAAYDPAANSWQSLAPMPQGRNHAASATDGAKLYVFGGRGAGSGDGNVVANGFNTLQIYNPATDSWQSSQSAGSNLAPLPIGRGGMGKAVYAGGVFYVMGGETTSGPGATTNKVYDRVDIYDPLKNSWSQGATMATPRHGIFPLLIGKRIYVAGGGTKAGFSQSNVLEIYNLPFSTGAAATPTPTTAATLTASPPGAATASPTPTGGVQGVAIRLNAGGPALSNAGVNWLACRSRTSCSGYVLGGGTFLSSSAITLSPQSAPASPEIYQSARGPDTSKGETSTDFSFPVPNGSYQLRLHFVEIDRSAAGGRVFDVLVENALLLDNYDIFARAGGRYRAVVAELTSVVSDGALDLSLVDQVSSARISGIELLSMSAPTATSTAMPSATPTRTATSTATSVPVSTATRTATSTATSAPVSTATSTATNAPVSTATSTVTNVSVSTSTSTATSSPTAEPSATATSSPIASPTPSVERPAIRINSGGPAVTLGGVTWSADQLFSGGKAYSNTNVTAIAATDDDALYLSERSAVANLTPFSYNIPLENGSYEVRLHFAEIYWIGPGGGSAEAGRRVFDVNIEGGPIELDNYDINAEVGPLTAVVKSFTVAVSDGLLTIDFSASVDQPKVSAIEIIPVAQAAAPSPPAAWPWAAAGDPVSALRLGVAFEPRSPFFCGVPPSDTILRRAFDAGGRWPTS